MKTWLGEEAGHGSAMKSVNQLLAGIHIAAMGEALQQLKADAKRIVEVISKWRVPAGCLKIVVC